MWYNIIILNKIADNPINNYTAHKILGGFDSMAENKNKKNIKPILRTVVFVLILTLCFNTAAYAADWRDHWAKNIFEDWLKLGILFPDINGDIHPESPIVRGELCSYINRIMGFSAPSDISKYKDTPASDPYYYAMSVAVGMGYISPTSNNALSPSGYITRAQVIDIFAKVAKLAPSENAAAILLQVRDADAIPAAAKASVAAAIGSGFIAGRSGYLIYPNEYMTVSEAVVLLDRLNSNKRVYAFPGSFGPSSGTLVSNSAALLAPGVNLKNADVLRDLEINREAKNGDIRIDGSAVREKLLVNGGKNIYLANDTINEIVVNKNNARLIYEEDKNTSAENLIINGDEVTVDINRSNKTNTIEINGENVTVNIGENVKINDLTVNGGGAVINQANGARIERVVLNEKSEMSGTGSVGSVTGQSPGQGSSSNSSNNGSGAAAAVKKITGLSFLSEFTLQVSTENVGSAQINSNDFTIEIDGAPAGSFSVSKAGNTEFNIVLSSRLSPSSTVTVTGKRNLTGSVFASQSSQSKIAEAIASGSKTINVTVVNYESTVFSKENFKLQIAGKESDSFTVTAISPTSYDLIFPSDIKSGQTITISGKNSLSGSVTVSAAAAIKSIVFNDMEKFTVNTDNTAGNTINKDCFDVYINGNLSSDYTVSEKSKTAYQITMSSAITEGTKIRTAGKKFLTGSAEDVYAVPFKVSKAAVTDKTNITVTLASVPESVLTAEKHAGAFKILVDGTAIPVEGISKDPSDKKGSVYNLTADLSGMQGILTVNGVKNSNNKGAVDYVSPELVSVKMNDRALAPAAPSFRTGQAQSKLIVEFSEPVFRQAPSSKFTNKDIGLSGAAFNIISASGGGLDLSGVKISLSANSVIIELASVKRMDPGIYTLTINPQSVFDALGNSCKVPVNSTFRFQIKGTHPSVASAKQNASGDIEIKLSGNTADSFGEAMSLGGSVLILDPSQPASESVEAAHRFISYDTRSKTLTVSRAALPPALNDPNNPVFLSSSVPYRIELYHPDYSRSVWQSEPVGENPLTVSRATIDTQRPKIETVSINGILMFDRQSGFAENPPRISKSNAVVQIVFSEPVFEAAPNKKFSAVDTFGQAFNIDSANALDPGNNLSLSGVKIATNNKTVSIPLKNASVMNPGSYKIDIDPALIFDSVGNTADLSDFRNLPGFPRLICHFTVVAMPPSVTSVSQGANGDISVRFTRYYPWLAMKYDEDICNMGTIRVLDMSRPEGERQIGGDITPEFFPLWNSATQTLTIKRSGLPDNLTGGPYVLEIDVPDYEKLLTPGIKINTGTNYDPAVTLGANNIFLTSNAEQTRIVPADAVINITFPIQVKGKNGANFTKESALGLTGDISQFPFSVYIEDGEGANIALDRDLVRFSHSGPRVTIDLTGAVTSNMISMKFAVAVNLSSVYDNSGSQIGNKLSTFRFKLTQPPLPVIRAAQVPGTGDIDISFGSFESDDEIFSKARDYINAICGVNDTIMAGSTVRIERRGEMVGYIPAEYIKDGVVTGNISPDKIVIKRSALEKITDGNGGSVILEGSGYTIVFVHSAYADNRTPAVTIDANPPILKDFGASISGTSVSLAFSFDEEAAVSAGSLSVTNKNGGAVNASHTEGYNRTLQVSFHMLNTNDSPSDYTVKVKFEDKFGNKSAETVSNPLIPDQHKNYGGLFSAGNIPGFITSADNGANVFKFGEGPDFETYFSKNSRKLNTGDAASELRGRLASAVSGMVYDSGLGAPAVTLSAGMSVAVPGGNVKSVRYTISKSTPSMQNMPSPGDFKQGELTNGNSRLVLPFDLNFTARQNGGGQITASQMESSTPAQRAQWEWTVSPLTELSCYCIFEWTMETGSKIYTYVRVDVTGS